MKYHEVLPFLNKKFLYHTLWQIKAEALATNSELQKEIASKTSQMIEWAEDIVQIQYRYGIFTAQIDNNQLFVDEIVIKTGYPFVLTNNTVGLQIVTLGQGAVDFATNLKQNGEYADYFYWHGFCAALTEALAACVHALIRVEMGLETIDMQSPEKEFRGEYPGKRLSFGYSALPDILCQRDVLGLLCADEIGVSMTDSGMLEPEYSTCAVVLQCLLNDDKDHQYNRF